jgi:hypothetical protein
MGLSSNGKVIAVVGKRIYLLDPNSLTLIKMWDFCDEPNSEKGLLTISKNGRYIADSYSVWENKGNSTIPASA